MGYAQDENQARVLSCSRKNSPEHARFRLGQVKIPYEYVFTELSVSWQGNSAICKSFIGNKYGINRTDNGQGLCEKKDPRDHPDLAGLVTLPSRTIHAGYYGKRHYGQLLNGQHPLRSFSTALQPAQVLNASFHEIDPDFCCQRRRCTVSLPTGGSRPPSGNHR